MNYSQKSKRPPISTSSSGSIKIFSNDDIIKPSYLAGFSSFLGSAFAAGAYEAPPVGAEVAAPPPLT